MNSAPVADERNSNIIQKYLIPEKSRYVRYVMQKAAHFGSSENIFSAHVVSVAFAVVAVAFSVFNAISYLLQAPVKILLNIVQFNPLGIVTDFVMDLSDMARSLLFVSLGVTFVVAGLLIPAKIFTYFSPAYYESRNERLKGELELAGKKNVELQIEKKDLKELTTGEAAIKRYQQDQIEKCEKKIAEYEREIENFKLKTTDYERKIEDLKLKPKRCWGLF